MPTERLQVTFERKLPGVIEDVAVITMHFQSVSAGLLDNTIRAAVEAAFGTFWTAYKPYPPTYVELSSYRWYDQQVWPVLSPLLRFTDITNVPATGAAPNGIPQAAQSITLETNFRTRWGRFYLPGPTTAQWNSTTGRLTTAFVDNTAAAAKTFLDSCKTAGAYPKTWSPAGGKGPPQFFPGDVTSVIGVRCDDINDIIRSRRWQASPYIKHLALA